MYERPTHVDLFSGVGGFSLAARWTGFKTVVFCEKDEWCQRVLAKNFGAEVVSNTRGKRTERVSENDQNAQNGTEGRAEFSRRSIPLIPDIRDFDGKQWQGATLLTGGFPCQPASCAGKRRGTADDRWLWPEMFRVIKDAKPEWIIGENVRGLLSLESGVVFNNLLSDLETIGYEVWPIVIPACATDAKHRRDRVWIICHAAESGLSDRGRASLGEYKRTKPKPERPDQSGADVADREHSATTRQREYGGQGLSKPESTGLGKSNCSANERPVKSSMGCLADGLPNGLAKRDSGFWRWPEEPPEIPRVATGVKDRVNKLKGLGNAIVPQVATELMKIIKIITQQQELLRIK